MTPPDMYKRLSEDSHGDPHPVMRLIDASNTIEMGPRRTLATRASLLMHAGFCRDQAVAIAGLAGITINGLPHLDAAIRAAWADLEAHPSEPSDASKVARRLLLLRGPWRTERSGEHFGLVAGSARSPRTTALS